MKIVFEPALSPEARQRIELGVDLHNVAATQLPEFHTLAFVLRDASGEVRGGLLGDLWGGWLHISFLWVDAPLRRQGWARKLMRAAERHAVARGARAAHLETFSFQARPLYKKLGYEVFATLEDFPPGHQKFFLHKRLK
jgi:ribosomal protein S18 acetylase RimI-like enzyme